MRDGIHSSKISGKVLFSVAKALPEFLALKPLAKEALAESRFSKAAFSENKFNQVAERATQDLARHGVLVATRDASPVGLAYCNIGEPMIGTGLLITTVQVLYVRAGIRSTLLGGKIANGLLNGVKSWSKSRGGEEVLIHLTSGIRAEETHRFLKRRGFETVGGSYVERN